MTGEGRMMPSDRVKPAFGVREVMATGSLGDDWMMLTRLSWRMNTRFERFIGFEEGRMRSVRAGASPMREIRTLPFRADY
jgi:hypothetical protein